MCPSQADTSLGRWDNEGGAPRAARRLRAKSAAPTPQAAGSLYYFNIRSDRTFKEDPEGSTLPDLTSALQEALTLARRSLKVGDRKGQDRRGWRVEIMDRANEHLATVAFTEADLCEWPRKGKSPLVPQRGLELGAAMEQRVSVITLAVSDLATSQAFYERLGWRCSKRMTEEVVLFQLGGLVLSLLPREVLAREAAFPPEGSGFSGVVLAYNTRSKAEVEAVMAAARDAGAQIRRRAHPSVWGGYSGYFSDLDNHLWEVAWNPGLSPADDGSVTLRE